MSNPRQRARPQLRWLSKSSLTAILEISDGSLRIASTTLISPAAIIRLTAARARRTSFARRSACKRCAPRAAGEVSHARLDPGDGSILEA
jgi:hypothetical protein